MSVFTNPASAAGEHAKAYVAAVLDLLGNRDPLAVLRDTPAWLRRQLAQLTSKQLATPEAPNKWSIGQVIAHLADSELVWAFRLRMILAHDRPKITGYDQDLWAERLGYSDADPEESLARFEVLRASNLVLLGKLHPADLKRAGIHAERGEETLEHLIPLYAGHDLLHQQQIERIRKSI